MYKLISIILTALLALAAFAGCIGSSEEVEEVAEVEEETKEVELANKWAIVEAVSDYPGSGNDLDDCHIDAYDVYNYLTESCGFPEEQVFLFINESSNPANLSAAFTYVAANSDENSQFVFYHSGHGTAEPGQGEGMILESGFCISDNTYSDIYTVYTSELKEWAKDLKSKNAVFIFDSCQTGEMGGLGPQQFGAGLTDGLAAPGRIVITGSTEATLTFSTGSGGSYTTLFLRQGLEEKTGDGYAQTSPLGDGEKDGRVSMEEAYWYAFWTMMTVGGSDPMDSEMISEMNDQFDGELILEEGEAGGCGGCGGCPP